MTSFGSSDRSEELCKNCGGPLAQRPAHPYPVALTLAFGACFLGFLLFSERVARYGREWNYVWSGIGVVLGILLIRGRMRAKKTVLRCIRCNQALG
jgi:hypothetical protein